MACGLDLYHRGRVNEEELEEEKGGGDVSVRSIWHVWMMNQKKKTIDPAKDGLRTDDILET